MDYDTGVLLIGMKEQLDRLEAKMDAIGIKLGVLKEVKEEKEKK